jgi:hypothetical protein
MEKLNPLWTTPNGQLQMDNPKWTRSHCCLRLNSYKVLPMALRPFEAVHLELSIWGCP